MTAVAPAPCGTAEDPGGRSPVEFAVTLTEGRLLESAGLARNSTPRLAALLRALGWSAMPLPEVLEGRPVGRLHFGNEFCETLIPTAPALRRVVAWAEGWRIPVSLIAPMLSDRGVERLRDCLAALPEDSEVIANDWGVLALLHRDYPRLRPVAGRLLCKMIKDPRLPSAEWARLYPHGVHSGPFRAVLDRFGVERIELDVPPYGNATDFRSPHLRVSVHAPFGYSVKGRSCRIGSLHLEAGEKFGTGHSCSRECLTYVSRLSRPNAEADTDLPTFQRGTTIFYRHSAEMGRTVVAAIAEGWIDRMVVPGDWPGRPE